MQRAGETGQAEHGSPAAAFSQLLHFALLTAVRGLNPIPQGLGEGPWHGDTDQPHSLSPWMQGDANGCITSCQLALSNQLCSGVSV